MYRMDVNNKNILDITKNNVCDNPRYLTIPYEQNHITTYVQYIIELASMHG
jgi:hypothetical protein